MSQWQLPKVGDGSGSESGPHLHREELALAFRNKALLLEGLAYDRTPVGMHYTLVHYDVPVIDPTTYRLSIGGRVTRPLELSLAELMARETRSLLVTLECAGDGRALLSPRPISQPWLTGAVGTAEWTGTPLAPLLREAGLLPDAVDVVFTGHDHGVEGGEEQDYQRALSRDEALHDDALLAWSMNGAPLEPQHGHPLRLIVPGWYGMAHVKWLRSIEAIDHVFEGYQHRAYRYGPTREPGGEPVTLMRVRSLMIPPGFPDFLTRMRFVHPGTALVEGRAWAGRRSVTRVEFSSDGGATWLDAELEPASSRHAWQRWRAPFTAHQEGEHELVCRATDDAGEVQPLDQAWSARGMGNNMAHRVRVRVLPAGVSGPSGGLRPRSP